MKTYRVQFVIEVTASSKEVAARQVKEMLLEDPECEWSWDVIEWGSEEDDFESVEA